MLQRLNEFIKNQGISIRAFEQTILASDGMIRRAIKNNSDIQSKWIKNISDNYPQLNIEWLITGEGEMLKSKGENMEERDKKVLELEKEMAEKDIRIARLTDKLLNAYDEIKELKETKFFPKRNSKSVSPAANKLIEK